MTWDYSQDSRCPGQESNRLSWEASSVHWDCSGVLPGSKPGTIYVQILASWCRHTKQIPDNYQQFPHFCYLVYGLDDRGSITGWDRNLFLFAIAVSRPALGPTQPPVQWVSGTLSPGVKRPEREADHSPSSSEEVKNTWIYTSIPPYTFMAWCLGNNSNNFTFMRDFRSTRRWKFKSTSSAGYLVASIFRVQAARYPAGCYKPKKWRLQWIWTALRQTVQNVRTT
jgi:hypothetical protein